MRKFVYLALSLLVSAFLIWYLLSRIAITDLTQTFANIYYPALFLFIALSLTGVFLRAWRYRWLLLPQKITWKNIFLITFIRNLFVDLLPARLGSLSYIYFLNQRMGYSFESAGSSFVVAFVFDFLTLSPFLILAMLWVGLGSSTAASPLMLVVAAVFFALILLVLMQLVPLLRLGIRIFERLLRFFRLEQRKWAVSASQKLALTLFELTAIRKRHSYWGLFFLSLALRLTKYGALYVLLVALLHSFGYSWGDLGLAQTILGITGAEFTSVLPIKGIGGFGTWETAWAFTFELMEFEPRLAIISGIGVHLLTNLFEYTLGILSILYLALPHSKGRSHHE
jgi:uncharacterized membrane protein YbhN (UPF0104 family)